MYVKSAFSSCKKISVNLLLEGLEIKMISKLYIEDFFVQVFVKCLHKIIPRILLAIIFLEIFLNEFPEGNC